MSKIKKLIVGILSAGALGYGAYIEQRVALNKPLMEYVDENIPKVMESHGKKVGIQKTVLPSALYVLPREFKINDDHTLAWYDPEGDAIYFDTSKLASPANGVDNLVLKLLRGKSVGNVETTLDHELGHHVVNAVSKTFNLGPVRRWHNTHETSDNFIFDVPQRNRALKLVQEGMAVYFEKLRSGEFQILMNGNGLKTKKKFMKFLNRLASIMMGAICL